MFRIPVKLLETAVKKGAKEVDVANPLFADGVNFVLEIAKAVVNPF
jgi:hypothetical protein